MKTKKLRIWPSNDQIKKLSTTRLLNILKLVRTESNKLLSKGEKLKELVPELDNELIENIARHLNMIERVKAELATRENVK
jgi:hypothetical protein